MPAKRCRLDADADADADSEAEGVGGGVGNGEGVSIRTGIPHDTTIAGMIEIVFPMERMHRWNGTCSHM